MAKKKILYLKKILAETLKKQVPQFFPLFAKKARSSLDIKLGKFVYTKTHLAQKKPLIFRSSENRFILLIISKFESPVVFIGKLQK